MNTLAPPEFLWGEGRWSQSHRSYVKSELSPAIRDAGIYLRDVLGLDPTTSQVLVHTAGVKCAARAVCSSTGRIDYYIHPTEIKRRKLGGMYCELATTAAHEMGHGIREEHFSREESTAEAIITEGFAYMIQSYMQMDVFDIDRAETMLGYIADVDGLLLLEELNESDFINADLESAVVSCSEDWPCPENELILENTYDLDWSECLGLWCIRAWIEDEGYDFPTLIDVPPEELLIP